MTPSDLLKLYRFLRSEGSRFKSAVIELAEYLRITVKELIERFNFPEYRDIERITQ